MQPFSFQSPVQHRLLQSRYARVAQNLSHKKDTKTANYGFLLLFEYFWGCEVTLILGAQIKSIALLLLGFIPFFHSATVLETYSESWLQMVEFRFLRKPEKMDRTLRLFFLLSDWAWWRDDSWLKRRGGGSVSFASESWHFWHLNYFVKNRLQTKSWHQKTESSMLTFKIIK